MTTRRVLGLVGTLVVAVVALAAAAGGHGARAGGDRRITVARVVDGDTVVARLPGGDESVRLIGIDTPESVDPQRAPECFGKEAAHRTGELLPRGTVIRLERDVEGRDRYGRLLAYVYRADGTFVNLALAEEGFAESLVIPPNVAYTHRFATAVAGARAARRGLWGACR